MTQEINISEMLKQAEQAADLRKKETLRLIEATKKVATKIIDVAKSANIETKVESGNYYIGVHYDSRYRNRGWGLFIERENNPDPDYPAWYPPSYPTKEADFPVYASDEYGSYRWNDGKYLPVEKKKIIFDDIADRNRGLNYEERKEAREHYYSLPQVPEEPDTINRKKWIQIAKGLPELAQKIAEISQKRQAETTEAANLAERLLNAIS